MVGLLTHSSTKFGTKNTSFAVDRIEASVETVEKLKGTLEKYAPSESTIEAVTSSVRHLSDGLPALMNALDEVAKLHPFIGGR